MIKHSPSYFQVSKTDASGKSSQIINDSIVSSEKLEHLLAFGVSDVENFLFSESGVVRTVRYRS